MIKPSTSQLIKLCLFGILIFQLSCKCHGVDCQDDGEYADIRLMRDGKNAVFGAEAFIPRDSIELYSLLHGSSSHFIFYYDTTMSMEIYLYPDNPLILKTPGRSDTLSCTTIVSDQSECCTTYSLSSVQWNGETICTNACAGILEIEI